MINLIYDCSHTCQCLTNAGIQRVVRSIYYAITRCNLIKTSPVYFDIDLNNWRYLFRSEYCLMGPFFIKKKFINLNKILSKRVRFTSLKSIKLRYESFNHKSIDVLIVPEPFKFRTSRSFDRLHKFNKLYKFAIFHDLIPLLFRSGTGSHKINNFRYYLEQLLYFDGIATISDDSKRSLICYWDKHYPSFPQPPIRSINLGSDFKTSAYKENSVQPKANRLPNILFVSSMANRKNHLSLLSAAETLWGNGFYFELNFLGSIVDHKLSRLIIDRINYLKSSYNRPVKWLGSVDDSVLVDAYRNCTFTVYPSLYEGFGLPVIESLRYGKPCLCTPGGALKEVSSNGGCHIVEDFTAQSISKGIKLMLTDHGYFCKLKKEALAMTFRTWSDYSKDILRFIEETIYLV